MRESFSRGLGFRVPLEGSIRSYKGLGFRLGLGVFRIEGLGLWVERLGFYGLWVEGLWVVGLRKYVRSLHQIISVPFCLF